MLAAFYTLGCKVNQYETAALEGQFAANGFEIAKNGQQEQQADVCVLNSCTVTASSDKKSRQLLRRLRRQNPLAIIALCGCLPQAFPEQAESFKEADIVVGSKDRSELLGLVVDKIKSRGDMLVNISSFEADLPYEPLNIQDFSSHTRSFVKIQDGCERHCAYCIIPKARGPIRSRSLDDIEFEIKRLALSGYKEIVLVGINLSCYGQDIGLKLIDALTVACGVEGIERVRLGSLEPELLCDSDILQMSGLKELCWQFHLSLQSGCDKTLSRMSRQYNTAEYKAIVQKLREKMPGCAITTDIMVGFPGETTEEFEASLEFVRQIKFSQMHVFAYSPRPGTPAATMEGQVSSSEKTRRSKQMVEEAQKLAEVFLNSQMNKTLSVLFEDNFADNISEGYSENYTHVKTSSKINLRGKILPITIESVEKGHCMGSICKL